MDSSGKMMSVHDKRTPSVQFSLLNLIVAIVMAGIFIGANISERQYLFWDKDSTPPVFIRNQSVVQGWPFDAIYHEWTQWTQGAIGEPKQWYPPVLIYSKLLINIGVGLTAWISGISLLNGISRIKQKSSFRISRGQLVLIALALLAGVVILNLPRPLPDVIGAMCWGWPQPFVQISPDGEVILFSIFSLLANILLYFSILGVACRIIQTRLRNE